MHPDASVGVTAECVGRLGLVVHVAEHDRRAADADLALHVGIDLVGRAGLDDLVVGIREGNADGADAVIVLRGQAAGRDALGQAVALTDLDGGVVRLQEFINLLFQLDGKAVAAAEHALEAAEVGIFQLLRAQQRFKQRRDARNDVRLLFDEQIGVGLDVELRDEDAARAANQGGVDADAEAEAVEHRHDGEHLHAVDGCKAGGRDGLEAKSVEVQVAEHDALGGAGRAA